MLDIDNMIDMLREAIEEKEWDYDPFKGLTILKSDYDKFFGSDKDIQEAVEKIYANPKN